MPVHGRRRLPAEEREGIRLVLEGVDDRKGRLGVMPLEPERDAQEEGEKDDSGEHDAPVLHDTPRVRAQKKPSGREAGRFNEPESFTERRHP